jgi:hypothetical protein
VCALDLSFFLVAFEQAQVEQWPITKGGLASMLAVLQAKQLQLTSRLAAVAERETSSPAQEKENEIASKEFGDRRVFDTSTPKEHQAGHLLMQTGSASRGHIRKFMEHDLPFRGEPNSWMSCDGDSSSLFLPLMVQEERDDAKQISAVIVVVVVVMSKKEAHGRLKRSLVDAVINDAGLQRWLRAEVSNRVMQTDDRTPPVINSKS